MQDGSASDSNTSVPRSHPKRVWPVKPRPLPPQAGLLLRKLVDIQDDRNLSDRAFARLLGLTNGHWSHIRACSARMGRKTLQAITRTFPQLQDDVLSYLNGE